jgi:hypothetical protein
MLAMFDSAPPGIRPRQQATVRLPPASEQNPSKPTLTCAGHAQVKDVKFISFNLLFGTFMQKHDT